MSFIHKFEDLSSRQKQIDELRGKRGASEKRIYLDEATNEFDLAKEIEIESKYLIFNPDNTRIRTSVLNHLGNVILKKEEIDPLDEFYQKKEDISTQNFLLNLLLERAKSGASIYKQLERVKNQTEHLLIDSDGVVIDGNRRLASMLWLYQEDSSKFPFKKIKCWALAESSDNRENNQKHETVIHHAESYQEPHSWIDIAYGAYKKLQIDEEPVNTIAKYYKTNAAKIYTHVNTAIAVNKYIEFREEFDKRFEDYVDIFEEIKKEDIKQDLTDIAKILKEAVESPEENLLITKRIESVFFILLAARDGIELEGRKYLLTNNSKRLLNAINNALSISTEASYTDFHNEIGKVQDLNQDEKQKVVNKVVREVTKQADTEDEEERKKYTLKKLKEIKLDTTTLKADITKKTADNEYYEDSTKVVEEIKNSLDQISNKLDNLNKT